MKQKLLKIMIAFIAIVMPNLGYAQSVEAEGTYNGRLAVSVAGLPAGSSTENIHLIAENDNHIRLEIRNFKFSVEGSTIELGDIVIPNVELQKEGNTITLLPTDAQVTLPEPIGMVSVHLNQSTIVNNNISLTLTVQTTYPVSLQVDVTFDGTKTGGSGVQNTNAEKPVIYYNPTISAVIVKGAESQKYDIYDVAGIPTLSGILNAEEINVSTLSRGLYLIKIGNNTVKFIKK